MPKGIPVREDVWLVAKLAIEERKLALPAKRIHWYCKWLKVKVSLSTVEHLMTIGCIEGHFTFRQDGRVRYYKVRK
jgi:hypothetical protein